MAAKVPARSILKQQHNTPQPALSDEQQVQAEKDRRNLSIALRHATRIQGQKNVEAQIANIEVLLELPTGLSFTASEASKFVSLLQIFQPSDFDNLVEERRIEGRCGYALCANAPRSAKLGAGAAWKLKAQGAGDYCSNDCLRKALYVKTQLSGVPAWEREPGEQPEIVLHEDDRMTAPASQSTSDHSAQQRVANVQELAFERGETSASHKPGQVMKANIVEKPNVSRTTLNPVSNGATSHTAIEGYEPMQGFRTRPDLIPPSNHGGESGDHDEAGWVEQRAEDDSWRDLYSSIDNR